MVRMVSMKGGTQARSAMISRSQSGCLELTNPTPVRLVYARPSQITLLQEDARTNVRGHDTAEVGIVRNGQRLERAWEGAWYSPLQVVVVQVKLGESGER